MTFAFTGLGKAAGLAAALLIGAMAAAIVLGVRDAGVGIPRPLYVAAQAVIGCMIAGVIKVSILREMAAQWPLFLGAIAAVLAAAVALGTLLTRWQVLPGTTALWGSFPGAATAMTLMAETFGADIRLVAFMQYLRVVVVALLASAVARLAVEHVVEGQAASRAWLDLAPIHWQAVAMTLVIAFVGTLGGRLLRLPVAPLIGPMILGAVSQGVLGVRLELPPALLAAAYAVVGWSIGLRFDRELMLYVASAFPRILAAILALVACCGLFAGALVAIAGIDPLTAYLATSPGGADSVAIIAASSKVDVPFVMAMQISRFLVILAFGPRLARFVADRMQRHETARPG